MGRMSETTKVVGVIPARWGSTRLPGKALIPLCGRPLILWVAEAVSRAERLDAVVVATDDERIRSVVQEGGWPAVMTRADHPSGTDRVAEAAASLDAGVVINIQGDEPLIDPALIDGLATLMAEDLAWDMATAATPIAGPEELSSPSVVKVVFDGSHRALYFSRAGIPFVRDERDCVTAEGAPLHWRHLGIYAYRRSFLERLVATPVCALEQAEKLEQLRALHIGARMAVVETDDEGMGVDTPGDVQYVEALLRKRLGG
jgi:3-deoxy-manno-octulosonate cytidylyltransferase (CMP-KDO synthetase)